MPLDKLETETADRAAAVDESRDRLRTLRAAVESTELALLPLTLNFVSRRPVQSIVLSWKIFLPQCGQAPGTTITAAKGRKPS